MSTYVWLYQNIDFLLSKQLFVLIYDYYCYKNIIDIKFAKSIYRQWCGLGYKHKIWIFDIVFCPYYIFNNNRKNIILIHIFFVDKIFPM